MDANNTRFIMLLGERDWGACTSAGAPLAELWAASAIATPPPVAWDDGRAELTLRSQALLFTGASGAAPLRPADRRGAACDRYGNWYWIDSSERAILVKSSGTGNVAHFWGPGDGVACAPTLGDDFQPIAPELPSPLGLRGLAVTDEQLLVVGVLEPPGLLQFDLYAGGPPRQLRWPLPFAPFDMAPAANGGLWILERPPAAQARLWALDRHLDVIFQGADTAPELQPEPDFRPLDGMVVPPAPAVRRLPARFWSDAALVLAPANPVAIEAMPDGDLLILEPSGADGRPFAALWRYRNGQPVGPPLSTAALLAIVEHPAGFTLVGHDCAFVPVAAVNADGVLGTLFVVGDQGRQAFAFTMRERDGAAELRPRPDYLPLRCFVGKGLVRCGEQAFYDSDRDWLPVLRQPRVRYVEQAVVRTPADAGDRATGRRGVFDSGLPGCTWHRLIIDGCLPADTTLLVRSRAADDLAELGLAPWRDEPRPYKRGGGAELPFSHGAALADEDSFELLLQRARGRFLQLELQLGGNMRATPRLRALRAYCPRFSYLERYLPAAYRADAASASFLDRFLANIEGLNTALEDRIAAAQLLFDVQSAPPEYLDWLASWFGALLDPAWDEARRRLFLAHAPQLFSQRGTLPGLLRMLRLATEDCPDASIFTAAGERTSAIRLVEQFRTRLAPGVVFGDPSELEGPGLASADDRWTPAQGAGELHRRYQAFLQRQFGTIAALNAAWGTGHGTFAELRMAPTRPATGGELWARFAQGGLGFTYAAAETADLPSWQSFLEQRYRTVAALNAAYRRGGTGFSSFATLGLPTSMPEGELELRDWIQFAAVLLPTLRNAHRFSVLVPAIPRQAGADRAPFAERVRQVVEREKPGHTMFELKEYWALFRVGEARLGFDSLLDRGSRLAPLVLGADFLAQSYLSHPPAPRLGDAYGGCP